jgi:hypothetical protein
MERRHDAADRRARRLYLMPKGKPLVDDIWHLVDLTRREAFAGIPRKDADLIVELLEKIQSNFASLEALPTLAERPELAHRQPDILAAEARLHAATSAVGVAQSNLYPKIQLSDTVGQQSLKADQLFDRASNAAGPRLAQSASYLG